MIAIKNLKKIYTTKDNDVHALNNINLSINKGEIFGVIGLSGAGKSSLIRCINMLEVPTSGEILMEGTDLTKLKPKGLRQQRKKIGMIFQQFNLLNHSTVYDNIAFPLKIAKYPKAKIEKRVNELLDLVELSDKKKVYPSQLSGGQKQRVGIARALANNPDVLLSDEATSALDPTTTEAILNLLKNINKALGITILLITHEMSVIKKICHKVAVMENGAVVEEGNVIDVFARPQTETSKKFLKDKIPKFPQKITQNGVDNEMIMSLSFVGDSTNESVISNVIKTYDVDINIISGTIEQIQEQSVGRLIIKIKGEKESVNAAINYLKNKKDDIEVEVINHG
ncbi:D-methionine transport system ATP-binding protein [Natranaerovirga hydrolytica]|uniref:D-methionine transport system ATP-binding protein n=1 Tax=Natranaerovirga hydrolytica TaxID=680378 RepID=A0A4V6NFC7_9FIRM|nr:methionine ABC transporter ATP-binding protein [Natranaerovirga hydrolytica]TCK92491.1 D-methionine transport system ATP-binding protein [Natranaerovirga hydrolytica]